MISNTYWILNVCDVLIKKDVPQDILEYMVRVIWGAHLLSDMIMEETIIYQKNRLDDIGGSRGAGRIPRIIRGIIYEFSRKRCQMGPIYYKELLLRNYDAIPTVRSGRTIIHFEDDSEFNYNEISPYRPILDSNALIVKKEWIEGFNEYRIFLWLLNSTLGIDNTFININGLSATNAGLGNLKKIALHKKHIDDMF